MLFLSVHRLFIYFLSLGVLFILISCSSVKKSFIALNNHDYYTAFNGFKDGLKRDSSTCAYGLSLYYDSPVTKEIDSSIKYILTAENSWSQVSEKDRLNFLELGFDSMAIQQHKQNLGDQLFFNCRSHHSISCFDSFINDQEWSRNIQEAVQLRDSLVLSSVRSKQDLSYALKMVEKYPHSKYLPELLLAVDLFEYQEYVQSSDEEELVRFIESYPNNSHVPEVENRIYRFYSEVSGYESIESFIEKYPENHNVKKAWSELYKRYTNNSSPDLIAVFKSRYPQYPFKDELNFDVSLSELSYYPFADSYGNIGYSDSSGVWLINAEYDDAGFFYEGIASVERNGKFGLINKKNELIVDFIFDDIETDRELYIVTSGDYLGVINRSGEYLFDTVYQDISILDEGFICAQKDSLYAFYNRKGDQLTSEMYDFVLNFKHGLCPVSIKGQTGLLNKNLSIAIPCEYEAIYAFSDSLFILADTNNYKQLSNNKGFIVNDSLFQEIHKVVNGYAICIKNNKLGYLDASGKQVFDNQFEYFTEYDLWGNFRKDRAVVSKHKKFGIIDTSGNFILNPKYDYIKAFGGNYGVKKKKNWAIMDSVFNIVSDYKYEGLDLINKRFILFQQNGKVGLMDLNMNVIIDAMYTSIMQQDHYFILSGELGNALVDEKGTQIVPFDSWLIYSVDHNHLAVVRENSGEIIQYIEKQTGTVINKP